MTDCLDCSGSRSVPDFFGDLGPCPSCVIVSADSETWVVVEDDVAS